MIKRIAIFVMSLALAVLAVAQEDIEHTNILMLKAGYGSHLDTYLSPVDYSGMHIGLSNEWWQPFRQDTRLGRMGLLDHWGHVGRLDITALSVANAAHSNSYLGARVAAGWGAFYCWKWHDDRLKTILGPYLESDVAVRYITDNVNKPVSLDIAVNAMVMAGLSWSFYGRKTSYRLAYLLRTNLVGFDYLPEYWQSYYELSQGVHGIARCSGPWNHRTVKHGLSVDMQFLHSTWRVGVEHSYNDYGTDNMHFVSNQISLVLGCIWQYKMNAHSRL
ncbi:MAG: DUF3316 domain-containing protein [Paludibacteraceae bacterium]|nr:DUF3316 domain-containing protein [Paludibacteraceae bacterium]